MSAAARPASDPRWPISVKHEEPAQAPSLLVADLISALSYALDLTEGQPMGWAVRTCQIGLRLADVLRLGNTDRADLYYALLLKDTGCSSNAARISQIFDSDDLRAKRELMPQDWTRLTFNGFRVALQNASPDRAWPMRLLRVIQVGARRRRNAVAVIQLRCHRGADIVRKMGFSPGTADAIRCLDEHWDGRGAPDALRGNAIPLLARVLNLSQTLALYGTSHGAEAAFRIATQRSGRWFDPDLVKAAFELKHDPTLWAQDSADQARERVLDLDPGHYLHADNERLDSICEGFADIIDAKSPFTYHHSRGVASVATSVAERLGMPPATIHLVRRAAWLHDIGKLGVSNSILDKPGQLTMPEWEAVRRHPYYTQEILRRVEGFTLLADIASMHHERLDGSGYHLGLGAEYLPMTSRVISVADVYDALVSRRPYREGLPLEQVFRIIDGDVPTRLDRQCVEALKATIT